MKFWMSEKKMLILYDIVLLKKVIAAETVFTNFRVTDPESLVQVSQMKFKMREKRHFKHMKFFYHQTKISRWKSYSCSITRSQLIDLENLLHDRKVKLQMRDRKISHACGCPTMKISPRNTNRIPVGSRVLE